MKKFTLSAIICLILLSASTQAQTYAFDTLDINHVRAVFNATGINFSDDYNSFFEAPKGSNNHTIDCNTLWMAGQDIHGSIYVSGGIGASTGRDYYPGPLTVNGTASIDSATMAQWNKVWKVSKEEILYHQSHYGSLGYVMPDGIANWPAHGDTSLHQAYHLAPFFDLNGDGLYSPSHGDYPLIRGDEAIFFIFNDRGGLHQATGGTAWGIEVQAMAYAFNCPQDSALNNTVFLHYKVINRRTMWLSSAAFGVYSDMNIGNPQNDFIRSDIQRNSYYTYSATNLDTVLGNYFPAQATTILSGLQMDPDGLDNPAFDTLFDCVNCNEAVNGMNFGDNIIDNERYGMTGFISFMKGGNPINNEPTNCGHYLKYLQTTWKDGRKMQYGGFGYEYLSPYGPECHFMYPGTTDPCDWGTNGNPPNGPRNWTEETASNSPDDRQGLAIMGPLSIDAGDYKDMDLAFIFGLDYSQPGQLDGWRTVLNQRIDSIRSYFKKDMTPCGGSISGVAQNDKVNNSEIMVYPNPVADKLYIKTPSATQQSVCNIYNLSGVLCQSVQVGMNQAFSLDVSRLSAGMYQIVVSNGKTTYRAKFVKY